MDIRLWESNADNMLLINRHSAKRAINVTNTGLGVISLERVSISTGLEAASLELVSIAPAGIGGAISEEFLSFWRTVLETPRNSSISSTIAASASDSRALRWSSISSAIVNPE